MNVPFFTPKAAASTLVGVGSMGGGGGAVYLYQMPKNWKDLLIKEGYVFLSTDQDYKGMFNDQKDSTEWKGESSVKEATENDVNSKAKTYCEGEFKKDLPSSADSNYATTKQKLIAFCTTDGIKTVKARLIQSKTGSDTHKWIAEDSADDKWKAVFAIYRYNDEFIRWLKGDNADNSSLSKESKPSENYTKLKNACTNLLKKNHSEIGDKRHFNYGSWWCVELGYTTIKEKIQQTDSGWTERPQDDSKWGDLKTKWKDTAEVKKWAKQAKANSSDNSEDLNEEGLKALCKGTEDNKGVKSKLSDDDSYQKKYLVIKVVCKQESES